MKRESVDGDGVGGEGGEGGGGDGNIDQNRDFYKLQDVRPPYTYAALIRQVRGTMYYRFKGLTTKFQVTVHFKNHVIDS